MRPYAPYSVYLGLAEAMINPDRLTMGDYMEMIAGMSRLGGTGLFVFDLARGRKDTDTAAQMVLQFAGQYMSSFSVPARQFRDIVEFNLDPEDAILRDTRQDPLLEIGRASCRERV